MHSKALIVALTATLASRSAALDPVGHVCAGRWGTIDASPASFLIQEWRKNTSETACIGDNRCAKIWGCGYRIAFWLCNDSDAQYCISTADLEQRLQNTVNICNAETGGNGAGQAFYADDTNVVVHECIE